MDMWLSRLALASLLLGAAAGCDRTASAEDLSRAAEAAPVPEVPVPAEDGPRLYALAPVSILEKPITAARGLGELRAGDSVARSSEPVEARGCEGGWYAVRPRGFVCAGARTSLTPSPFAPARPDASRPLPYRYGYAKTEGVPLYARVPTVEEQLQAEPGLLRHLKASVAQFQEFLGPAANDVPLDERGVAKGPPMLLPTAEGVIDGRRVTGAFFAFTADALPVTNPAAATLASPQTGSLRKGASVAVTGSFVVDQGEQSRRFGVLPDGRLVPTDRLTPLLGSTWHGIDLTTDELPIAFVHKLGATTWEVAGGDAIPNEADELERRQAVVLTGRFRTVDGRRYEELMSGSWARTSDLVVVVKRTRFPDYVSDGVKWLDVSIATQTLTAYEGKKAVYATLISSGNSVIGAEEDGATPRGEVRVTRKMLTRPEGTVAAFHGPRAADAPWAIELDGGYGLVGTAESNRAGQNYGFRDIRLGPIDARRIFDWIEPPLPEGWSEVDAPKGGGTRVSVRR